MTTLTFAPKSKYRFLDPDNEDLIAEAVPVDGTFVLTPPQFDPLDDQPDLGDGAPPTAVGQAVMEWWSACTGRDPSECPTGLVRAIEAVSATGDNVAEIRRSFRGRGKDATARWRSNHAGRFSSAQIEVLVPMVGRATVQPRENARYGRILREKYDQPLIHEIGDDLVLRGQSAEHFHHIRLAQADALDPASYSGAERKSFVDSLALEGIREELRGFAYVLCAEAGGERGHHVETDDGYTRVAVAQATISNLLGGLDTDLSRRHWNNGDGTLTVRDWTPDAIVRAQESLRFHEAPFQVWPTTETRVGVRKWIADAPDAAHAVSRLMTARMEVGIVVEPHRGSSTHMVVFGDMARFHVKGHQPAAWNRTDEEAFKARTIVSQLGRRGFVSDQERDVFFGNVQVPWKDEPERTPYRNRLIATVDTMVKCVVDDPVDATRYAEIRAALKEMHVPNSPSQAAASAASMAIIVSGMEGQGEMGAFSAMLKRSFANAQLRRIKDHKGNWTARFDEDLDVLVETARAELDSVLSTAKHGEYVGPSMRAVAILGMVAHGMNPELVAYRKASGVSDKRTEHTIRWPSSMTISGRGGRAGAGAADAHVIVLNMARSPKGLGQLEAIIRAVTDHGKPVLPLDPETGDELLEDNLRVLWNSAPTIDGEPHPRTQGKTPNEEGNGDQSEDDVEDDVEDAGGARPTLSETGEWERAVDIFAGELRALGAKAEILAHIPAGPEPLGLDDQGDWDPDDETLARMIEAVGIDPELATDYDDNLERVRRFFLDGIMAFYRMRLGS